MHAGDEAGKLTSAPAISACGLHILSGTTDGRFVPCQVKCTRQLIEMLDSGAIPIRSQAPNNTMV